MLYFKGLRTYDCVMLCTWSVRVYNGNEILSTFYRSLG